MSRPTPIDPTGQSWSELRPLIATTLRAGISALVRGHPGVGKSALAAVVAEDLGLPMHDIRLAQREPAEIAGVFFPDRDKGELALFPPAWVRSVCEAPAMVFLDEVNAAVTRLHQAAAYQIVLEKRVGPLKFHPDTVVLAAGNLDEDRAITTPLSSALANRFAHFTLRVDVPTWLSWAEGAGIHPAVIAYFRAHQRTGARLLYDNHGGDAFPTPRSWAMVGQLIGRAEGPQRLALAAACVGVVAAERFEAFFRLYDRLDPEAIITGRRKVDFSRGSARDPSFAHAAVLAVCRWVAERPDLGDDAARRLVEFLASPGLDAEQRFAGLRELARHSDWPVRLRTVTGYPALAADIVDLHQGLYT